MSENSLERFEKAVDDIEEEHTIRHYCNGEKVTIEDYVAADGLFCLGCFKQIRSLTVCCPKEDVCKTSGAWLLTPKNQ